MKWGDVPWERLRLAGEIALGVLAWYWIAVSYPVQTVFPVYANY